MKRTQRYTAEDQTIALAGVFQAGALVADIAHGRPLDEPAMRATLGSLFATDPDSVAEVFGGVEQVRLGLLLVRDGLQRERQQAHGEVLRYALSLVQTERQFSSRRDLQDILHSRLARVAEQRAHFELLHATIIGALASAYQDTLSTLRQRIQVVGNAGALQDERNADRIRAVLLGGVRAALLWHQTGGRRWRLLLNQSAAQRTADALVERIS
ncbi:MAG: high frequency lysogenization protein HflD [Pseudomonadales bacterium]|nr:high frequency lysogenization protein HflD [Pseudomonadales bacterium]